MIYLVSIMLNEIDYVDRWMDGIMRRGSIFDRILVVDGGSTDGTVERLRWQGVNVIERPFDGDYSAQRNFAIEQCDQEWIFELDADEVLSTSLLAGVMQICRDLSRDNKNRRAQGMLPIDSVGIPRLNFIDEKIVAGPGHRGLDYQYRLHTQGCRWRGRVHEELHNPGNRIELDVDDGHFIRHMKSSTRHAVRNAYYETLKGGQ